MVKLNRGGGGGAGPGAGAGLGDEVGPGLGPVLGVGPGTGGTGVGMGGRGAGLGGRGDRPSPMFQRTRTSTNARSLSGSAVNCSGLARSAPSPVQNFNPQ